MLLSGKYCLIFFNQHRKKLYAANLFQKSSSKSLFNGTWSTNISSLQPLCERSLKPCTVYCHLSYIFLWICFAPVQRKFYDLDISQGMQAITQKHRHRHMRKKHWLRHKKNSKCDWICPKYQYIWSKYDCIWPKYEWICSICDWICCTYVFVLNMTVFVLSVTGCVLNVSWLVQSMTGFVLI